ncbi:MAG: hypothetical protein PHI79_07075 [Sulfurovaceae bacterium]|nr:hypothetical protein [Sulfurovaceae bacterium]MDD5549339.1 hypothetical protein [Sulfurovaceae bacterium]
MSNEQLSELLSWDYGKSLIVTDIIIDEDTHTCYYQWERPNGIKGQGAIRCSSLAKIKHRWDEYNKIKEGKE